MARRLTTEEILALPASVDLVTAGRAWGFGRTKSHELARAGAFPCPVLMFGRRYVVTRAAIMQALGVQDQPVPADSSPAAA